MLHPIKTCKAILLYSTIFQERVVVIKPWSKSHLVITGSLSHSLCLKTSWPHWKTDLYSYFAASPAESESWNAEVPQSVVGLEGSCVVIPCLFRYPGADRKVSHLVGIWLMDSNEKVYHPVTSKISTAFQQRTSLWGDLSHHNCSLKIDPLRRSDSGPFTFRIEIEDFNKYSFIHNKVSITIKGECYSFLKNVLRSNLLIV